MLRHEEGHGVIRQVEEREIKGGGRNGKMS